MNLLVGGGLNTIIALHKSLISDVNVSKMIPIPLVIIKNSGRAADLFSHALEYDNRGQSR